MAILCLLLKSSLFVLLCGLHCDDHTTAFPVCLFLLWFFGVLNRAFFAESDGAVHEASLVVPGELGRVGLGL
jgi:hypothetical protein